MNVVSGIVKTSRHLQAYQLLEPLNDDFHTSFAYNSFYLIPVLFNMIEIQCGYLLAAAKDFSEVRQRHFGALNEEFFQIFHFDHSTTDELHGKPVAVAGIKDGD